MDRKIAAALVSALALGLAGCGSAQPKLTRAQLVTKIDLACEQSRAETARQMGGGAHSESPAEVTRLFAAVLTAQQAFLKRLDALNPPAAAKQDFDAFRQGMEQRQRLYEERLQTARRSGIQSAVSQVAGATRPNFLSLDRSAKRLGVVNCV